MKNIIIKFIITVIVLSPILYATETTQTKIKLQLQWKYQFQFAGFIVAKEYGYYNDEGLDVEILEYNNSNIIKDLENDTIDFGINNSIIAYNNKKLNAVTLIASYFQRSPLILITQPNIKSMLDLEGKRVMMSRGNRYNSSLTTLLDYFNLNNEKINFLEPSFNLEDFINKKVDAITGFRSNELYELNQKKIPYNVIDPVEYGFSTNAINLFASTKKVQNNPEQIRKFLSASKKGWAYALAHIEEVAKLIHTKYQSHKSINHLIYEGENTKKLMLVNMYDIGEINEIFVLKTLKQLIHQQKVDHNQSMNHLFLNQNTNPSSTLKVHFTKEEKLWLTNNPSISFTGNPNWMPYESFKTDSSYVGIVAEHLKLIQEISGLSIKTIPSSSWKHALKLATNQQVQVISGDNANSTFTKNFTPVKPYIYNPIVIIMNREQDYVENLNMIADKKIAIIKNYGYTNEIIKTYPKIKFIEVDTIQEGLKGVAKGDFDAILATMALANYTIQEMQLYTLKIVGKTPIVMNLTLFVSKEEPLLYSIINKTLRSITQEQQHQIVNKWLKSSYIERVNNTLLWQVSAVLFLLLLLMFAWSYRMRIEIQKRTKLEQLNKSIQERLSFALEGSNDGLWDWNLITNNVYYSPRWKAILGYTDKEIENTLQSWERLIHPDDIKASWDELSRYLQSDNISDRFSINFRMQHKDGHFVPLLSRANKIIDKDGKAIRMVGTHVDLTELIKIQEAYKRERDKGELYLDTVDVLLVALDTKARVTMLNRKGEELLGYKEEELLGKNWFKQAILPPEIASNIESLFGTLITMDQLPKEAVEHHLISKSGQKILFNFYNSLLFDENQNCIGLLSSGMDITELKKVQQSLQHQAEHDALTDLPNRILFVDSINKAIKDTEECNKIVAILFIDLDHFKEINDSLGHTIGDMLLKLVSHRLKNCIRKSDTVGRQGGDEFTIVLDNIDNINNITTIAQKIITAFKEPFMVESHQLYITLSIGISVFPNDGVESEILLKNADAAMYKAKKSGRNNYQFYTEDMTKKALERVTLETQLRQSLKKNQMQVYYQAQIDARDDKLLGMEVLLRWHHPTMGLISPAKFIPLAEETGFIVQLDEWAMGQALVQFRKWYEEGFSPGIISLNLSPLRLEQKDFIQKIQKIIKQTGANASWINLEVTEGQIMRNPYEAIKTLQTLNDLGIKLAIDDFGTGYSSLSYLTKLPINKLKIDQSFIKNLPKNSNDAEIVKTIISMSKGLNLSVIAEGVETAEQKEFLVQNGCYEIQGYLYHKPSNAQEIQELWLHK